eukprot:m.255970 g.255970  ORF g.255970 m.255970 type:complete len:77 (-) comp17559_c1_seq11:144-374(-)
MHCKLSCACIINVKGHCRLWQQALKLEEVRRQFVEDRRELEEERHQLEVRQMQNRKKQLEEPDQGSNPWVLKMLLE